MNIQIISNPNPDSRKNWLITVEISDPVSVLLTFVPDKLMAEHESIKNHIIQHAKMSWDSPEEMILKLIEDINNELVPKWLKVKYSNNGITVEVEDFQPGFTGFSQSRKIG